MSTDQKLFGGWLSSRDTVDEAPVERSSEPCSEADRREVTPWGTTWQAQ
ncbi:hypothetical protein [Longibacter salinarum]|nr:hypothetical protein [Longibacter salinarum]